MAKPEKEKKVEELKEKLKGAKGIILSDCSGLDVKAMSELRRQCREASVQFEVVKNTLTSIAAKEAQVESLLPYLTGPVALAFSNEDPMVGIRIITDFAKENERPEIKGGYLWGEIYGPEEIQRLASLPPRETLLAQTLRAIQSPLVKFLYLIKSPFIQLLILLKEMEKKANHKSQTPNSK